jgi:hypothetical protein
MEDIAEVWLKENDPFFGKKCKSRYSYRSNAMMEYRQKREIPASNVYDNKIRLQFDLEGNYRD